MLKKKKKIPEISRNHPNKKGGKTTRNLAADYMRKRGTLVDFENCPEVLRYSAAQPCTYTQSKTHTYTNSSFTSLSKNKVRSKHKKKKKTKKKKRRMTVPTEKPHNFQFQ